MHTLSLLRAGQLAGITRIDLSCDLNEFPTEIFELADSLEILNLSGNALSSLPDDLPRLHKLRIIFCSDNQFTELPKVLGQCLKLEMVGFKANRINTVSASSLPKKLRWLILTDNKITALPSALGSCTSLQKLMLAGNQLQELPVEMANCSQLELLRISANCFTQLPHWLLSLPRLSWLAYAGNPFSNAYEAVTMANHAITHVDWATLELQHTLGEGASGIIYRAHHQLSDTVLPVAVKVFKGSLTSDGLPQSEKSAYIAAGSHPGLIPVIGKVSQHPENTPGLVMSLIAPSFINLAGPPSLESCTRDIYPAETKFTLPVALNIALSIASVTENLHRQGVMHGDLYAHNILWNTEGDCLLGDFGAASFLPLEDMKLSPDLQRLEVRAFACLLEELLDHCEAPTEMSHITDAMHDLLSHCAQHEVHARPLFNSIKSTLLSLNHDTQLHYSF